MSQPVPPEIVALVRRRYAAGDLVAALRADTGLSLWALYRCLDGKLDDGSGTPLLKLPRRRDAGRLATRAELVKRLWRSAEQQVDQIEARMAQAGQTADDSERDARALAVLIRTLRELEAFDTKQNKREQQKPTNDQPVPRDIGELRRELARKMEALLQDEPGAGQGTASALGGEPF